MIKQNFQKELEKIIAHHEENKEVPTLLLHSCCAPCSSYVLEYLSQFFSITLFYYNPNITEEEEYRYRVSEQQRLLAALEVKHPISFVEGPYEPERFFAAVKGLEDVPEGGARCEKCFALRLKEAARLAKERGDDYFTTTLTISPLKNAQVLNAIGTELAQSASVAFLPSDFKKKNGYKRSLELSQRYGLYRQDYCGCVFSKKERDARQEKILKKK